MIKKGFAHCFGGRNLFGMKMCLRTGGGAEDSKQTDMTQTSICLFAQLTLSAFELQVLSLWVLSDLALRSRVLSWSSQSHSALSGRKEDGRFQRSLLNLHPNTSPVFFLRRSGEIPRALNHNRRRRRLGAPLWQQSCRFESANLQKAISVQKIDLTAKPKSLSPAEDGSPHHHYTIAEHKQSHHKKV